MSAYAASLDRDLMSFLRRQTRDHHAALEEVLTLLHPPLRAERFRAVLSRFYGFHAAWEPEVGALPRIAAVSEPRSRLPHLRTDLYALGMSEAQIAALPRCSAAAGLAASEASAIGSLYVVEGSTLGGQVISRALAGEDWVPDDGLSYFNPYGSRTGAMWRSFAGWVDAQAPRLDWDEVADGARGAFAILQHWLPK